MKVLIAACPYFDNYPELVEQMDFLLSQTKSPVTVHTCFGRGSDRLGERYARDRGYEVKRFYPNYEMFDGGAEFMQTDASLRESDAVAVFYRRLTPRLDNLLDYAQCLNKKVAQHKQKDHVK